MGIELEFKLAVSSPELLETILFDPQVKEVRRGDYQLYHMATIYYDTPDRRLGTLRWTLRLRQENNTLVATLKTPAQGNIRGEWSCQAANIREVACGERPLYRALRADVHEHRRLHRTVRAGEFAAPRAAFGLYQSEHALPPALQQLNESYPRRAQLSTAFSYLRNGVVLC